MEKINTDEKVQHVEVLEFELNADNCSEKYGIEIQYLNEVYSVKKVTRLPCTPVFVIGIINFRGKIISVIDIRNFLGFSTGRIEADNVKKVIVVKVKDIEVGIAADSILLCNVIPLNKVQKNALKTMNFNSNYFKGITKEGSIILNIKNIILDEKIIIDEEVT